MRGTGGTQLDCGYKDYRFFGGGTLVAGGGELASAVAAAGWWVLVRTAVEIQCFPPIRDETANGWGTRPLQGLKPSIDSIGFVGPTEVVPLLQSLGGLAPTGFSAACKVPFIALALCRG